MGMQGSTSVAHGLALAAGAFCISTDLKIGKKH